jgi:hypothetical protein
MTFLRLLGRTLTEPAEFIRTFFASEYAEVIDRYKQALYNALPDVPKAEIVWRLHFMLGAMSYAIAGTDVLRVVTGCELGDLAGEGAADTVDDATLAQTPCPALDAFSARRPARPTAVGPGLVESFTRAAQRR